VSILIIRGSFEVHHELLICVRQQRQQAAAAPEWSHLSPLAILNISDPLKTNKDQ
jgi:hypothetical protein